MTRSLGILVLTITLGSLGCGAQAEPSSADTETIDTTIEAPASSETRTALGVERWVVVATESDRTAIEGRAADETVRARFEVRHDPHTIVVVRYEEAVARLVLSTGDGSKFEVLENSFLTTPKAKSVLLHMATDLATLTGEPASAATKSVLEQSVGALRPQGPVKLVRDGVPAHVLDNKCRDQREAVATAEAEASATCAACASRTCSGCDFKRADATNKKNALACCKGDSGSCVTGDPYTWGE